jgi:hypothetical protein
MQTRTCRRVAVLLVVATPVAVPEAAGAYRIPTHDVAVDMQIRDVKGRARVLLFGTRDFRLPTIVRGSVHLRLTGPARHARPVPATTLEVLQRKRRRAARLEFRVNLAKAIRQGYTHATVTGVTNDGPNSTAFGATEDLVTSTNPADYCAILHSVAFRCTFTTSFADSTALSLPSLVSALNTLSGINGDNVKISASTHVEVELWGGAGHDGDVSGKCASHGWSGGTGGDRGYAQSAQTVSSLEAINGGNVDVYAGQDGPDDQNGASSSMLLAKGITSVSNAFAPSSETFVGIAGGGGGGGLYNYDPNGDLGVTWLCYNGHSGGDGGVAVATTAGSVAGAGSDAPNSTDGNGGSDTTSVTGANGQAGTGGFGGSGTGTGVGWTGSSLVLGFWGFGSGGPAVSDGGGGGGYGGGGAGTEQPNHYSGGGGGGSWALQDSVSPNATYQVGQSGYGQPGVILTFAPSQTDQCVPSSPTEACPSFRPDGA